ncbi:MAG: nucleoside deaminase [Alphaproteobacteria bacterium]|nr:nucleoside deaminase [Alphaproteobacteria bacterium]
MYTLKPMDHAFCEAEKAFSKGEVPVGASIIEASTGNLIATSHNEMVERKDPTAHAELLVIQKACQILGLNRLEDCDIYVTLEPCPMCAQAISFARFRRLYFGAYDPKGGGVDHGAQIFQASSCHHKPEVVGGMNEAKCAQLLMQFFQKVRGTSS